VHLTETRPVVLITGISASGKSTVAQMLARVSIAAFTFAATCSER
jgi:adenylylsulfate kinase-like enzyme